jgi:signal transduction histidine kinase
MAKRRLSLTAIIAATAALLTVIVHGATSAYFIYRSHLVDPVSPMPIADQASAAAALLIDATEMEEARILRALNSPYLIVRRLRENETPEDNRANPLEALMRRIALGAAREDELETVKIDFDFIERSGEAGELQAFHLPVDERVMRLVLEMPDGRRYLMISDSPFLSLGMLSRQFGNTLLLLLLVVGATLFIIRGLVAPLSRFAEAADRLKEDIDAPALDERRGLPEVQSAAKSFNEMQRRLKELIAERTDMLAAISHDMRTLVTRWGLRAETIEDADLRARSLCDVAELNEMITQFLDFSRASSQALTPRKLDLASVAQSVCDEFKEEGYDVACDCEGRVIVNADQTALKRVIRNLVSNAVRYGKAAKVSVSETGEGAEIIVRDQGPGLPEEKLLEVFEPYKRLDTSRSRETGGMGLGLAIVKTLAMRIGARVELQNCAEGGLCARVAIPKN